MLETKRLDKIENNSMVPLKVLVVENEVIIAENICDNLETLGYEVLEPAVNYTEALQRIEKEKPDIAILDIQLSGRKTGIDLAKEIRKNYDFPFIFLTSHADKLTINEAKQTSPPAYLIKPFTKDELYSSIEISIYNHALKRGEIRKENSDSLIIKDSIFFKEKGTFCKVKFDKISYLRSSHVYIDVILINGQEIIVRGSLNEILPKLNNDFIRIHRGYIINTKHLNKIDNTAVLIGEEQLPIGNKYREDLLKSIITV